MSEACPLSTDGVHHMGTGLVCQCGHKWSIPPICVSIDVFNKSAPLIQIGFNCDTIDIAIAALRSAADKLERCR
jgi:hypothetical protein